MDRVTTTVGELANVVRSKNAGPFQITIDLMFADEATYRCVLHSRRITREYVARAYAVPPHEVSIIPFAKVWAIKITVPRTCGAAGSGSAYDRDVYGAQQHGPIAAIEIPDCCA